MSKPCRELLDTIENHEEFLEVTHWTREEDSLVFHLADRVERVLAIAREESIAHHPTPKVLLARRIVRLLDGEEP